MALALVAVSFPLGLGADPTPLRAVAPGLVWVSALLAVLLALDGLFREDAMDGTLEQWLLSYHRSRLRCWPVYWRSGSVMWLRLF